MHAIRFRNPLVMLAAGLAVGALSLASTSAIGSPRSMSVLELFTSQGCSSCPPADALLEKYKSRDDVIALSLPVDYWDRLGWKDTFASRGNTDRQRDYARVRGDGQIYTPQIVVNGRAHAIGSSAQAIDRAIAATQQDLKRSLVPMTLAIQGGDLVIDVGKALPEGSVASASILLAAVQDTGTVSIGRGENAGREITYHNVVRDLKQVGVWSGTPLSIRIPRADLLKPCCEAFVVMLQQGQGGPVISAAKIATRKPGT